MFRIVVKGSPEEAREEADIYVALQEFERQGKLADGKAVVELVDMEDGKVLERYSKRRFKYGF